MIARTVTLCVIVLGLISSACAKSTTQTAAQATESPAAVASASPMATTAASAAVTATAAASPTPAPKPTQSVAFTDISGIFAQAHVIAMAKLGVFDSTSGQFKPQAPISRAEFVRWLVKANNAYYASAPDKQIRPAEGSEQTFVDVPSSNPDYRYIQALANAGFVIGIDDKHFAPNRNLTREEMIAIKVGLDKGGDKYPHSGIGDVHEVFPVTDADKINKRYYDYIYGDYFDGSKNLPRVFGAIKTFYPQKPVTRAEAALCLDSIGDYAPATAEAVLNASPSP